MYCYTHSCNFTYIHTCIFIGNSMIMLVNATCYPIPTTLSPCLPRCYDLGTTSMPFLLRWYYVNTVLTMLSLGPYHVL